MIIDESSLSHYGVKGMQWGVRKQKQSSNKSDSANQTSLKNQTGASAVQKALAKAKQPDLSKEQRATLKKNKALHDSKFESSEATKEKGWRPTKKQMVYVAAGAVVTGAIIYKLKTGNSPSVSPFSSDDYLDAIRSADSPEWLSDFAGKKMSPTDFKGLVDNSSGRAWTESHITKDLFSQKEFTLPKGHQFYRISQRAESSFGEITYSTESKADFARYLGTFKGAANENAHQISFSATDSVKVPDLKTRLDAFHKVLAKESPGRELSPKAVLDEYTTLSGGGYSTPKAKQYLSQLRSQGYHAIIDEMDVGVYGQRPLVMIDSTRLSSKVATPLSKIDTKSIVDGITDITNRR